MKLTWLHLPPCEHCGPSRVLHVVEKLVSLYEAYEGSHPPAHAAHFVSQQSVMRKFNRAKILAKIPGFSLVDSPKNLNDTRAHALFEGAAVAGVYLQLLTYHQRPVRYFASKKGRDDSLITFRVLPSELLAKSSPVLLDDKYQLCSLLHTHGIPTGKVVSVTSACDLPQCMQALTYPVIIKPRIGTRGRHTVLAITSAKELRAGFSIAKSISSRVVVQEELSGFVYRFTVVDGKFIACALRDAPYIVADGVHTIKELVASENENPLRSSFLYKKIPVGKIMEETLKSQGLSLDSIPAKGQRCVLHTKNSRLNGTIIEDVTDKVHPSIVALFENAARLIQYPVLGFDALFSDITQPLKSEQREGIIECNSLPYIDAHHFPYRGRKINVSAKIWEMVYRDFEKLYPLP